MGIQTSSSLNISTVHNKLYKLNSQEQFNATLRQQQQYNTFKIVNSIYAFTSEIIPHIC